MVCLRSGLRPSLRHTTQTLVPQLSHEHWYRNRGGVNYVNDLGDTIRLGADGCVRYPAQGVLAGAALPLSRGVAKIRQVTGCTLAEAIRMATANPARLYGITDRGELRPGMRADLIVFRPGPDDLAIERTYVAGTLVHDASARAG